MQSWEYRMRKKERVERGLGRRRGIDFAEGCEGELIVEAPYGVLEIGDSFHFGLRGARRWRRR